MDASQRWHPQIILIATFFYLFGLIIWCIHCYFHQKYVIIHHKLLTVLLTVRLFDYLVWYISYCQYNKHGISTNWDLMLHKLLNSAFEVIGFLFLMLVSMGY